jgi:uncharacterized protein YutE (UPF0331/DUF86 family)
MDRDKVLGIIARLETDLGRAAELAQGSREAFLSDNLRVRTAERLIQLSIQGLLDISNHLIACAGFRAPVSHGDSFEVLVENEILPEDFLPSLRQLAQYRNRLVHLYWDIEPETMYDDILRNRLEEFDRFVQCVLDYMDREE